MIPGHSKTCSSLSNVCLSVFLPYLVKFDIELLVSYLDRYCSSSQTSFLDEVTCHVIFIHDFSPTLLQNYRIYCTMATTGLSHPLRFPAEMNGQAAEQAYFASARLQMRFFMPESVRFSRRYPLLSWNIEHL